MKIAWQAYDKKDYTAGPIVNAVRVLPELVKRGHQVYALIGYHGDEHPNADILAASGVEVVAYRIPYYSEPHVRFILETIHDIQPDVFVSNISVQAAFAGRWVQKWGIPVIHTHRGDNDLNNGTAHYFFKGPKEWRLTALVSVNQFLLDQLNGTEKLECLTRVIPSGVPITQHETKQDSQNNRIRVVYAGRIVQKQKRVRELVEAFIELAFQNENLDFSLLGDGDNKLIDELKAKIDNAKLDNRILFKGRLDGDRYKDELSNNHILVLLSDFEGISGAVMDGMECGVVPVVLRVSGIDELVHHMENGIIVENRTDDLYSAIDLLIADSSLRRKISKNAMRTILDNFSLDKTVTLWEELFEELRPLRKNGKMKLPACLNLPAENVQLVEHKLSLGLTSMLKRRIVRTLMYFGDFKS